MYSGGGIEPDKFMAGPVEGFIPTRFGRQLYARGVFVNFADQFMAEGDTRFSDANKNKKRDRARASRSPTRCWRTSAPMLTTQKVTDRRRVACKTTAFISAMIHYEIDLALFGVEEARRNLIQQDPQAQFAHQPVRAKHSG